MATSKPFEFVPDEEVKKLSARVYACRQVLFLYSFCRRHTRILLFRSPSWDYSYPLHPESLASLSHLTPTANGLLFDFLRRRWRRVQVRFAQRSAAAHPPRVPRRPGETKQVLQRDGVRAPRETVTFGLYARTCARL